MSQLTFSSFDASLMVRDAQGQKFLSEVALAPPDMAKLCHGNADALLKLKP